MPSDIHADVAADLEQKEHRRGSSVLQRVAKYFPAGQLMRYIGVGVFNAAFAYLAFAIALWLLDKVAPERYMYLTVIAASIIATPINITVAYFGYKFVVFKTKGNYVREWIKCFGVYGIGMLPGLFAVSAITRVLQPQLHHPKIAGYIAGALVQGFTVVIGFLGHKNITFRQPSAGDNPVG